MSSYTHFSPGFNDLLDVSPKGFLAFPSESVRGLSASKAWITVENVNSEPVAFRVLAEQNCTLQLRACPTVAIIQPSAIESIEVVNNSDHPCTMSDRIYIEAVVYKDDVKQATSETIEAAFEQKTVKYYCLKCYETNDLILIPMQEELFKMEQRLKTLEHTLKTFNRWFVIRTWSYPLILMLLIFFATLCALMCLKNAAEVRICQPLLLAERHKTLWTTRINQTLSDTDTIKYTGQEQDFIAR